jgi:hypothetical protein
MADLDDGQGFWQPPAASGRLDNQRRIIGAAPVGNEKPEPAVLPAEFPNLSASCQRAIAIDQCKVIHNSAMDDDIGLKRARA